MPPSSSLASSLAVWRCPSCARRSLSSSSRRSAVGPEHPRYVNVPEPPQQTTPYRPPVKGVLPVPRNIFSGMRKDQSSDEAIADATKRPNKITSPAKGSREEWKSKMSDIRRQNLREGLKTLKNRQAMELQRMGARSMAKQQERHELLSQPEREDERLTTPSNNLNVEALLRDSPPDSSRDERLRLKAQNVASHKTAKTAEREAALHTLYMHARDFIVTPGQLDAAIDVAFGTPEEPKIFGGFNAYSERDKRSIWAEGQPKTVQDMLNLANGKDVNKAMAGARGFEAINADRMRRIAERLTGGAMDDGQQRS